MPPNPLVESDDARAPKEMPSLPGPTRTSRRQFIAAAVLVLGWLSTGPTASSAQQWRSSWEDGASIEHFLREAKVTAREKLGRGVTNPDKVTLELDGITRHAIFKHVQSDYDSWRFEIGAYELDKVLGLGLVPPTVERRIGFRKGCLQLWVLGETVNNHQEQLDDMNWWRMQVSAMWLFDDLTANVDRHLNNAMVSPTQELILIDHSKAFQSYRKLLNDLDKRGTGTHARFWRIQYEDSPERYPTNYPESVLQRLQSVSDKQLRSALGKYVNRSKMYVLLKRRQMILERLGLVVPEPPGR